MLQPGRERERRLLSLVVLCLYIPGAYCSLDDALNVLSTLRASVGQHDQISQAAAGEGRGRSLLQNPDRPALNKYGGVNMTTMLAAGYPLETYKVTTPDGWVLSLYRIPHGKNRNTQSGKKPVVYLHHGITLSSACFTLLNENESMAYILADAGFDVWLPNMRGNTFSRGNFYFSHRQPEYWYHGVDEYALIDNPAMVDKVLEVSGASKLAWVGHSQGGSNAYALLSSKPEYNEKVSVVIQMGPVWYLQYFQAPFLRALGEGEGYNLLNLASSGEFLWERMYAPFVTDCRRDWFLSEGCVMSIALMLFGPSSFVSIDDYSVIAQTWPASVSTRNLQGMAQNINRADLTFRMYDYGTNCTVGVPFMQPTCNQLKYGTLEPPAYDLSKITAPVVLLEAEMDIMATADDVTEQARRLTKTQVFSIVYQHLSHMDFVWDRNARHMLDVVDIAFRYAPGTY